jgi:GT2 family glycosyltransferase
MDLSITIVNMDGIQYTEPLLESIRKEMAEITFEVLVVDNNSSDNSVDLLKSRFPWVRLVESKATQGFAVNQNMAIRQSRGRYVVILNNDMLLLDNAFKRMVEFMDHHPEVGAVGPKLVNPDGSFQIGPRGRLTPWSWGSVELELSKLFPKSRLFGSFFMTYWDPDRSCMMETAMGACMMVRREVIEQVGLLDEHIFFGTDDLDWSYRIRKAGWKLAYLADISIIHYGGVTIIHRYDTIIPRVYKGFYWFFLRHYGWHDANVFRVFAAAGAVIRLVFWSMTYLLHKNRRDRAGKELRGRWAVLRLSLSPHLKQIITQGT